MWENTLLAEYFLFTQNSEIKEEKGMIKILKRDGSIMDFDIKKIENAIERAFMQEHKFYTHDLIEMLALRVTADFNSKIKADLSGSGQIGPDPFFKY